MEPRECGLTRTGWANNTAFPFVIEKDGSTKSKPDLPQGKGPGFDAIIGQAGAGAAREIQMDAKASGELELPVEWVVAKGGEYFFTPSLSALRGRFALPVNGHREL